MRSYSLCIFMVILACCVAGGHGTTASAEPDRGCCAVSTHFRGLVVYADPCAPALKCVARGFRNGSARFDACIDGVRAGGQATLGVPVAARDIDAIQVEICTSKTTMLRAAYPDNRTMIGERRIRDAFVRLGARGAQGWLTVHFLGGGTAAVPLAASDTAACAKSCPQADVAMGSSGAMPLVPKGGTSLKEAGEGGAGLAADDDEDSGPRPLVEIRVRNNHPAKRVRKAEVKPIENAAAGQAITVRNVVAVLGDVLNTDNGGAPGVDDATKAEVTVCLEGGPTLSADVVVDAPQNELNRIYSLDITVTSAEGLVVTAVLYNAAGTYAVSEKERVCENAFETIKVTNNRTAPVVVRVLAGTLSPSLKDGNPFTTLAGSTKYNWSTSDETYQTLVIRVCTNVAGKNLNFPLDAGSSKQIRTVDVVVAANGNTVVTAKDWNGGDVLVGTPTPANPCPGP